MPALTMSGVAATTASDFANSRRVRLNDSSLFLSFVTGPTSSGATRVARLMGVLLRCSAAEPDFSDRAADLSNSRDAAAQPATCALLLTAFLLVIFLTRSKRPAPTTTQATAAKTKRKYCIGSV